MRCSNEASCVLPCCGALFKADEQAHRDRRDYVMALRVENHGLEANLRQQLRQVMQVQCSSGNGSFDQLGFGTQAGVDIIAQVSKPAFASG